MLKRSCSISPAPRVAPARVNGGGGGRSELVITWEVNLFSPAAEWFASDSFSYTCGSKVWNNTCRTDHDIKTLT